MAKKPQPTNDVTAPPERRERPEFLLNPGEITLDETYGLPTTVSRRKTMIAVIECRDSNPNGDPNRGGDPRVTPEGYGFIRDACIKRVARDYADKMLGLPQYIARGADLTKVQASFDLDADKMIKALWDLRLFGGVLTVTGKRPRGAMQVSSAWSVLPVDTAVRTNGLTRVGGHDSDKQNRKAADKVKARIEAGENADEVAEEAGLGATMGEYTVITHAVYVAVINYDVFDAAKLGLTEDDIASFYESFIEGWQYNRSAHRTGVDLRRLVVFEAPVARGREQSHVTAERVTVTALSEMPAKFSDYRIDVDLDGLPDGMKCYEWSSERVKPVAAAGTGREAVAK